MLFDEEMLDKKSLRPGALAMLKASTTMNKMVKKYVRKPMIVYNNDGSLSNESSKVFLNPLPDRDRPNSKSMPRLQTSSREDEYPPGSPFRKSASTPMIDSPLPYVKAKPNVQLTSTQRSSTPSKAIVTPATPHHAGVNVSGRIVPTNYFKDELEMALRRHDSYHRKLLKNVPSADSSVNFNDSVGDSRFSSFMDVTTAEQDPDINQLNNPNSPSLPILNSYSKVSSQNNHKSSTVKDGSVSTTSFNQLTYRSKISSIVRLEDDYSAKWMKMRDKRQQIIDQEKNRDINKELIQKCRSILLHSEKNELNKFFSCRKAENAEVGKAHFDDIYQQRQREINGYRQRKEKTVQKKLTERKQLKKSLTDSVQLAHSIIHEDVQQRRQNLEDHGINRFSLDDTTSTIIPIPEELTNRVKTAKSLIAYEQARKELKQYQENELSQRINKLVKSREVAKQRAANIGLRNIALHPMRAGDLFTDSLTLNSGVDDQSSALFEELSSIRSPSPYI